MISAVVERKMSLEEFFERADERLQCELIEGEFIQMPPPSLLHQALLGRLYALLLSQVTQGSLWISPVSFVLVERVIVQPDIAWLSPDTQTRDEDGKRFIGAPDLAIEILSPSNALYDRRTKFELYERYGTREYWLLNPEEQLVEIYVREGQRFQRLGAFGADDSFSSPTLGVSLTLKPLFPPAPVPDSSPEPASSSASASDSASTNEAPQTS